MSDIKDSSLVNANKQDEQLKAELSAINFYNDITAGLSRLNEEWRKQDGTPEGKIQLTKLTEEWFLSLKWDDSWPSGLTSTITILLHDIIYKLATTHANHDAPVNVDNSIQPENVFEWLLEEISRG